MVDSLVLKLVSLLLSGAGAGVGAGAGAGASAVTTYELIRFEEGDKNECLVLTLHLLIFIFLSNSWYTRVFFQFIHYYHFRGVLKSNF
jgi:hypothetical protein